MKKIRVKIKPRGPFHGSNLWEATEFARKLLMEGQGFQFIGHEGGFSILETEDKLMARDTARVFDKIAPDEGYVIVEEIV